ncbi:MAG: tetratricopeptide repeat protein [Pseudomonadota bacterium]
MIAVFLFLSFFCNSAQSQTSLLGEIEALKNEAAELPVRSELERDYKNIINSVMEAYPRPPDIDNLEEKLITFSENAMPGARQVLALFYQGYFGGYRDDELSFYWLEKAIDNGSEKALIQSAVYHAKGIGTPQDGPKGMSILEEAYREADDPQVKTVIGLAIATLLVGKYPGIEVDYPRAYRLAEKAARQDVPDSSFLFAMILATPDQYGETRTKEALVWFEKALKEGYQEAHIPLGYAAENGIFQTVDLEKAQRHYQNLADMGDATAMHLLARLTSDAPATSSKGRRSRELFEAARQNGIFETPEILPGYPPGPSPLEKYAYGAWILADEEFRPVPYIDIISPDRLTYLPSPFDLTEDEEVLKFPISFKGNHFELHLEDEGHLLKTVEIPEEGELLVRDKNGTEVHYKRLTNDFPLLKAIASIAGSLVPDTIFKADLAALSDETVMVMTFPRLDGSLILSQHSYLDGFIEGPRTLARAVNPHILVMSYGTTEKDIGILAPVLDNMQ